MSISIIQGDALDLPLSDGSVDLIVTSPPYFGLRSYQDGGEHYAGQIGDEETPAEFVGALIAATREMARVLKPSGSIWVNLGDKYSRGARPIAMPQNSVHAKSGRPRNLVRAAGTGHGKRKGGIASKSLMGIPWRYALRCIDDLGLILRAEVIWSKPNGLPDLAKDRVRRSHEHWFHFTKEPYYFHAIDESFGSIWDVPTQPLRVPEWLGIDHFAAFPMEFPRRIIRSWSPEGGIVLDPFGGTGTTALVAKALGRHGISLDMSADYCRLAEWRTNDPSQLAKAAHRPFKPSDKPLDGQCEMFDLDGLGA